MNPETSLVEVAGHLPVSAARLLSEKPSPIQEAVLRAVRSTVIFWEAQGVALDPIAYDAVLSGYVSSMAAAFESLAERNQQIVCLRQVLAMYQVLTQSGGPHG